jgi:hypothetical protein
VRKAGFEHRPKNGTTSLPSVLLGRISLTLNLLLGLNPARITKKAGNGFH